MKKGTKRHTGAVFVTVKNNRSILYQLVRYLCTMLMYVCTKSELLSCWCFNRFLYAPLYGSRKWLLVRTGVSRLIFRGPLIEVRFFCHLFQRSTWYSNIQRQRDRYSRKNTEHISKACCRRAYPSSLPDKIQLPAARYYRPIPRTRRVSICIHNN